MEWEYEKAVGGKTQNKYCAIRDGINRFKGEEGKNNNIK